MCQKNKKYRKKCPLTLEIKLYLFGFVSGLEINEVVLFFIYLVNKYPFHHLV